MHPTTAWTCILLGLLLLLPAACGGGGPLIPTPTQPRPLPTLLCTEGAAPCGELVPFEPGAGEGYADLLLANETAADQRYDYVRRDVMQALQYAAAKVSRVAAGWGSGHGLRIGIAHMSESDGGTPRTPGGQLMFPAGTYENGLDVSVAYYQTGTPDNSLRAVCPHDDGTGGDAFQCTGPPTDLDAHRTAFFIACLAEHPQFRLVGVDGAIGPILESTLDDLVRNGFVTAAVRAGIVLVSGSPGFEQFHHTHMYVSFSVP